MGDDLVVTMNKIKDQFDIIIGLLARQVLDPVKVKENITKGAKNKKRLIICFNLCDGKTSLTEISKRAKIDHGGLSRQVDSWEKDGYVFKLKDGKNILPKALIRLP
jgi:DNA-binding MarR family transcriptional regulator